ncbi:fimbrial protein [Burkholderia sp. MSMB1078WGS]|uniref:fimbrial protein n=1 Tax=Burkholderia sp. MSMB1078WGS TaxID=1637900 RepID=UPI00211D321E|nr:fimbrial protein [Burkholderia sp. MSMB1078WGS]
MTYKGNRGSNNEKISTGIEGNNNDVSGTIDLLLRKSSATPSSGVVAVATKTLFYLTGSISSQTDAPQQIAGLNNIVFTTSTCDVDTGSRSITVQLGDIRRDYFSGIGSTSTDRNFVINLNCSQPSGIYNVTLKLNATRDNTGAPGVMALDERGDKATGVGIQLLMNGTPVEFGTFASVGSATTDTTLSVPMTARYYQTANPVTPGVANAVATFLVNYK